MKHKDSELHLKVRDIAGVWKDKHHFIITNVSNQIELDLEKYKKIWKQYVKEGKKTKDTNYYQTRFRRS